MSKLIYTVSDFLWNGIGFSGSKITLETAVEYAQLKYNSWIDKQKPMYMHKNRKNGLFHAYEQPSNNDTHTARLVCIEEIAPAKCEHKLGKIIVTSFVSRPRFICQNPECGKELEPATWREK